jgi:hypothetical protein
MFELKFRELDSHDPRRVPLRGVAWLEPHMSRARLQVADGGPAWTHEGFDASGVAFKLAAGGSALLTVDKPVRLGRAEPGGALLKLTPARSMRKAALAALTAHHPATPTTRATPRAGWPSRRTSRRPCGCPAGGSCCT